MKDIDRYEEYAERLRDLCRRRGLALKLIGRVGPDRFPLYQVSLPARRGADTVCIAAGIHGDERSGPLSTLAFLDSFRPHPNDPHLIVFPCLNPFGFDRDRRHTSQKRDPNRKWTLVDAHVPMHAVVKRILKAQHVRHFMALHEDDKYRFYLYVIGREQEPFYRRLLEAGRRVVPVFHGRKVHLHRAEAGLVMDVFDGSMEHWMHNHGAETSTCVETPDYLPMAVRVKLNLAIMKAFIRLTRGSARPIRHKKKPR